MSREELKSTVAGNDSLKDQVFDLVVDAEKKSKRKILDAEGVEESHLIICGLLFKDNELYAKKMEEMANARMEKLAELGLNNQCHVCRKNSYSCSLRVVEALESTDLFVQFEFILYNLLKNESSLISFYLDISFR